MEAISNTPSPADTLRDAIEQGDAQQVENLCKAVIDLAHRANAMQKAMEAANTFFLHNPDWDYLFEPAFYPQFHQALKSALDEEPGQVYRQIEMDYGGHVGD